jgi:hypothetical protein
MSAKNDINQKLITFPLHLLAIMLAHRFRLSCCQPKEKHGSQGQTDNYDKDVPGHNFPE